MFPIFDPNKMKPERSELKEVPFFVLSVAVASMADAIQILSFAQWSMPANGWQVESVHIEDDHLELHCVKTAEVKPATAEPAEEKPIG